MLLVGLTGGLASGKTTVAQMFEHRGASIIDADQLARFVVQPGRAAWRDIVQTFGKRILRPDRTIDREKLAQIVFHHPRKLLALNRIVHPRVAREQGRAVRIIKKANPQAVIIYDAALLIEANAHARMDRIILVTTPQRIQVERACKRNRLSRQESLARIRRQLPLREKKPYANYLIDGTLPLPQLRQIIKILYGEFSDAAKIQATTQPAPHHLTRAKKIQ